ncbi:hypothetical protein [Bradyrhizobium icense]|uniref:Uncharacterized protein n=1 Tax=Bradyrhizobium icense TaxID=1274631 RepID=A0A1B1UJP6_9BRAD|nr:hypothetical protein [Bradyrhizobium icense]ANW02975.1 hypothetical protein LMTR13_25275 [Bradyrhizobium icense]
MHSPNASPFSAKFRRSPDRNIGCFLQHGEDVSCAPRSGRTGGLAKGLRARIAAMADASSRSATLAALADNHPRLLGQIIETEQIFAEICRVGGNDGELGSCQQLAEQRRY